MQKIVLWILGLIIIIGGWYLWMQRGTSAPSEASESPAQEATDADMGAQTVNGPAVAPSAGTAANAPTANSAAAVTYNGSGFSPSSVTIKKGEAVTFTSTAGSMWVASAPHPAHTGYDGTPASQHCAAGYSGPAPFDQCAAGASFTFTFDKTGTWNFHNHLNAAAHGSIIVE